MKASDIAAKAAELVSGDRAVIHGDKLENHRNIASLWNAYLSDMEVLDLGPEDVAAMMALLKIARMKTGETNPDDWIDAVGYLLIGGEIVIERGP
jgi:hypothetical protein